MASKPPGSPPKLTDGNLLNSGKNELLIKVSYSEEFGTVAACKLDEFLLAVQSIQELWDVRCTVGSRILEKPQSEGTDSVQAESSTGTAVANDLEVTRYYCKTALSYNEIHEGASCTNKLLPSVLLELFFTYDPRHARDIIAQKLKNILGTTISGANATQVKIVSFLLTKD
ncbi:uncharacterized protein LOC135345180 [Halichondria panicea]|uniref:uncharacterized protein LOC135345180 n=1 Tax=Halichondria panicea TaxID=6063 RepID=UPI00312B3FCC